jgi:hypothetical protein
MNREYVINRDPDRNLSDLIKICEDHSRDASSSVKLITPKLSFIMLFKINILMSLVRA